MARICKQAGYTHIQVLDSIWFSPCGYTYINTGEIKCIGVVKVLDTITNKEKTYIGYGKGESQVFDEDLIIAGGNPMYGVEITI